MRNDEETAGQTRRGEVVRGPTRGIEDVVASRAVATDRVFRGGVLSVLGFGGALVVDALDLTPGLPLWISTSTALIAFGAGAIWAGSGASHLIRHGRKGSSLWLLSLVGLGGSVTLNVVSRILMGVWDSSLVWTVNRIAMASCGLFTGALIVIGLITLVRWILPDSDGMVEGAGPDRSEMD